MVTKMSYWDERYNRGRRSSVFEGILKVRERMWGMIPHPLPDHVIDYGCGDTRFWLAGQYCDLTPEYVGIDSSSVGLKWVQSEFRPDATFHHGNWEVLLTLPPSPMVFCVDVLFHILDDSEYINTIHALCAASACYLFVTAHARNPYPEGACPDYLTYRPIPDIGYLGFTKIKKEVMGPIEMALFLKN